jgi:broad specificity phosphatase PhoE
MTDVIDRSPPRATAPGSQRVRLGQVSRDAALGVPGSANTSRSPCGKRQAAGAAGLLMADLRVDIVDVVEPGRA